MTSDERAEQERLRQELDREAIRVATLLHDELGQFLALAHLTLADIARSVPAPTRERVREVRRYLDHIEERLRESARGMWAPLVREVDVIDAIRLLAKGHERQLNVPVIVSASIDVCCPASVERLLYRFAHDALALLAGLAGPSHVALDVHRQMPGARAADAEVCCTITSEITAVVPFDEQGLIARLAPLRAPLAEVGGMLTVTCVGNILELRAAVPLAA